MHALFSADGVDRHDVRMLELCRDTHFPAKPLDRRFRPECRKGEDFDGHLPRKRQLLSLVDDAHAAAPYNIQTV